MTKIKSNSTKVMTGQTYHFSNHRLRNYERALVQQTNALIPDPFSLRCSEEALGNDRHNDPLN